VGIFLFLFIFILSINKVLHPIQAAMVLAPVQNYLVFIPSVSLAEWIPTAITLHYILLRAVARFNSGIS